MPSESSTLFRSTFRALGSLWFAAVLLVLLLVAMACATVFESIHGTEQALAMFYFSRWFTILLSLLGVNVLAAVLARFPFNRKQYGFVLTHLSILVIFAGALVTKYRGLDGSVGILEGQTVNEFGDNHETVTIGSRAEQAPPPQTVDVTNALYGHFRPTDIRHAPVLTLGELRGEVVRYLPDSSWERRVHNDNPRRLAAVEVSLSPDGTAAPEWIFVGRPAQIGGLRASLREVSDVEELAVLLDPVPASQPESKGTVRIVYAGTVHEFPVERGLTEPVPLGESGYTARVVRHLLHAVVAPGGVVDDPGHGLNPYIEVEITGPEGTEVRKAFSRVPDFRSMHGDSGAENLKLTFVTEPAANAPATPIELLRGPGDELYARFARDAGNVTSQKLTIGTAVETPWSGFKFAVLRYYDHARAERSLEPVEPVRKGEREERILLRLTHTGDAGESASGGAPEKPVELWLRKNEPRSVTVAGQAYDVIYQDRTIPLDFSLKLDHFRIGYYPGGRRPRSFESQVTITEPSTGRTQSRVISMNHPTSFGGYTFYQSSYRQGGGQTASFLSVSRDPGQPIVFAGYIGLMAGMLWVLVIRMTEGRRKRGATR